MWDLDRMSISRNLAPEPLIDIVIAGTGALNIAYYFLSSTLFNELTMIGRCAVRDPLPDSLPGPATQGRRCQQSARTHGRGSFHRANTVCVLVTFLMHVLVTVLVHVLAGF